MIFTGYSGFLHQLQLAEKMAKNEIPVIIKSIVRQLSPTISVRTRIKH